MRRYLVLWLVLAVRLCCAEDAIEELTIGKETYKGVRVIQSSPVDLLIGHEGGYKRIKLQDLPSPLKGKYPFDAKKIEVFEQQKAAEAKLRQTQTTAQIRAGFVAKEQEIKKRIEPLEKELKRLKADLKIQNANAKGRSPRSAARRAADASRTRSMQVQDRIYVLQDELEKTEAMRKKYE